MPTFLITSDQPSPSLEEKIKEMHPEHYYVMGGNIWLVDAEQTTEDLAASLGIRSGKFGKAAVFKVDGYSGFHKKDLWEWLTLPS